MNHEHPITINFSTRDYLDDELSIVTKQGKEK